MGAVKKQRVAFDPGDDHVGVAHHFHNPAWQLKVFELTPTETVDFLIWVLTNQLADEIVVEEFVLYDREYANQTWSPMKTSQLIGSIKTIAYMFRVPVVEQGAYIKKPTRAQMRARGIKHLGTNVHMRDAELHLHHRRLREAQ